MSSVFFYTETNSCSVECRMGGRATCQILKGLAAFCMESGGVTLLPFLRYVSSLKKLEHRVTASTNGHLPIVKYFVKKKADLSQLFTYTYTTGEMCAYQIVKAEMTRRTKSYAFKTSEADKKEVRRIEKVYN